MEAVVLVLVAVIAGIVWRVGLAARRRVRRRRIREAPLPGEWVAIIARNLPPYRHLSGAERRQLHGNIQLFLAEKSFEGCGGLEMTDEIRVTIAAQACLLLLNRRIPCYPRLSSILVYPSAYVAGTPGVFGTRTHEESVRLGESWHSGVVVLAWDSVLSGARGLKDGRNVTLHEFAHQLDQEDGRSDGTPIFEAGTSYGTWARVLHREFSELERAVFEGRRTVLDEYGATNEAEFFAVATETFFERPRQLLEEKPELYAELKAYYRLDPIRWG